MKKPPIKPSTKAPGDKLVPREFPVRRSINDYAKHAPADASGKKHSGYNILGRK